MTRTIAKLANRKGLRLYKLSQGRIELVSQDLHIEASKAAIPFVMKAVEAMPDAK